ncbi:MAG: PSD1 domain-containing protein [Planctomycetes bacterium]|nr:PSD1 domain-containing protein [Planctomycetota bacterium]
MISFHLPAHAIDVPTDGDRLFTLKVLPLLSEKCFACHGNDEEIEGELNMLSRQSLLQGGESGEPPIVPGRPDKSLLISAVRWEDLEMPPKENDRLTDEQIELLRRWILADAPWPNEEMQRRIRTDHWSQVETEDGLLVKTSGGLSDEWTYRRYNPADLWAYQPLQRVELPTFAADENPIDFFVRRKLDEVGLVAAVRANSSELIRRASFDLTGLPPDSQLHHAYADDRSQAGWQALIDRLLASSHYGERMAQHWLDVVRYADTSGYANDFERPHAWRYRDYVIRSFNADKPFDRFVVEQIAGDELEPDNPELRVAVGFLRMGPWEQTAMSVAAVTRQLWLDDVTNGVGETFLGHTLRCARCHDHKFDPVPTRDYYSMQAVFAGTEFDEPDASFLEDEQHEAAEARMAVWKKQFSDEGLRATSKIEGDDALKRIKKKLGAYRKLALARYDAKAFSVGNRKPQAVHILIGGAIDNLGPQVEPAVLSAVPGGLEVRLPSEAHARRLSLARWIASADNPLTARVIVNRVWQWHFGRGLVATPNNFGKMGGQPSHPELLDFLAGWFLDNGWSIKKLHRLIMTSETYQRSSRHPSPVRLAELDPKGLLLARFRPRRLTAEEIRDAMLATSHELNREGGGPGIFPTINWEVALQPRHIMGGIAPPYRPSLSPKLRNRRTIYAFRYRGLTDPMLEVLNRPNADLSCERRDETTVVTQAFTLFNGQFTHDRAVALAQRVCDAADSSEEQVKLAFQHVYRRHPNKDELQACLVHLAEIRDHHMQGSGGAADVPEIVAREMITEQTGRLFHWEERMALDGYQPDLRTMDVDQDVRALANICLVLLNSSEYLYVY